MVSAPDRRLSSMAPVPSDQTPGCRGGKRREGMKRAVRAVLRLMAVGLFVFGGMEIGLEVMQHLLRKVEVKPWPCVIGLVLIGLGVLLFCFLLYQIWILLKTVRLAVAEVQRLNEQRPASRAKKAGGPGRDKPRSLWKNEEETARS